MKKINIIKFFGIALILAGFVTSIHAQQVLTKKEAVDLVLANNFDLLLADNATELAEINASKFNTGQFPVISMDGSTNYRIDNTKANFQDGRTTTISGAGSNSAGVSLDASYTLFDGLARKYNINRLKELYQLSELQYRATVENMVAQTLVQYFTIAALSNTLDILDETLLVSHDRLERAELMFDYGQSSRLAVLNAQVDLNNDSLDYIDLKIDIENAKRVMNNLMVVENNVDYEVVVTDSFSTLPYGYQELYDNMLRHNSELELIDKNIEIGNIEINLAEAMKLPRLNANASYGYAYNNNNAASFLASSQNHGLNLGLTARWNIFDGGATKVAVETAKLNLEALQIEKAATREALDREFDTAWANYQNAIFVYNSEEKNTSLNRLNFERTVEQFKVGQLSSVDFRQAQLNLLNAETSIVNALYELRIAELQLLLMSGKILEYFE